MENVRSAAAANSALRLVLRHALAVRRNFGSNNLALLREAYPSCPGQPNGAGSRLPVFS